MTKTNWVQEITDKYRDVSGNEVKFGGKYDEHAIRKQQLENGTFDNRMN